MNSWKPGGDAPDFAAILQAIRQQQGGGGQNPWSRVGDMAVQAGSAHRRANPTPARFTHNSPLEVAWTLIPVLILVFIGSFSLPELFKQQDFKQVQADITIKATGNQWFWSYEYPEDGIAFDSFMLAREDLALGSLAPLSEAIIRYARERGRITIGEAIRLTDAKRPTLKAHFTKLVFSGFMHNMATLGL